MEHSIIYKYFNQPIIEILNPEIELDVDTINPDWSSEIIWDNNIECDNNNIKKLYFSYKILSRL